MDAQFLLQQACGAMAKSDRLESGIDPAVLSLHGMSSPKIRHLINNLCSFNQCSYLEVGSWKGSTLCSALSNNMLSAACCFENFAEFTDSEHRACDKSIEQQLNENIAKFRGDNIVTVYNKNFFEPLGETPKTRFNVYLYDGVHSCAAQYMQLKQALPLLADSFILLVDDWFCKISRPKDMTLRSIHDNQLYIHLFIELPSGLQSGYWNGQGLFVLGKRAPTQE